MEDRLCALFAEFRLGRSPSPRRSQRGESSDRKENPPEKEEQATDLSYLRIRVDFPSTRRWRPDQVDFARRAVFPLSQDLEGFYGR
ncbi:hypothetical protein GW17_00012439 [Ensete ventricosum]|nr:hypothetical protein GW17_00012439 [Ensete ventricosum]